MTGKAHMNIEHAVASGVVSAMADISGDMLTPVGRSKDAAITSPAIRAWLAGANAAGPVSLTEPIDAYVADLWVYKCIRVIQDAAKGVPLRFSRRAAVEHNTGRGRDGRSAARRPVHGCKAVCVGKISEGEIVDAGPVVSLFDRPNNYQTWPQFVDSIVGCRMRSGRVAIVKADMTGRVPGQLHVVDGVRIEPKIETDSAGFPILLGYEYQPPKTARRIGLGVDEVVWLNLWSPRGAMAGLAPTVPGRLAIATDYSAAMFNAAAMNNSGEPGVVIEVPQAVGNLTAEQRAEVLSSWERRHTGPGNAKRVAILEGGAKANPLSSSFADLQFNEGKKTTRLEICALYGVPPAVAGWVDAAGDSSAYTDNAQRMFWENTVFPLLDELAAGLQRIVDAMDVGLQAWFDVDDQPVVQRMRLARMETAERMDALGVPVSDINSLLDLGLPERPWYDVGFRPMNLIPADQLAAGVGDDSDHATEMPVDPDTGDQPAGEEPATNAHAARSGHNAGASAQHARRDDMPSEAEIARLWAMSMRPWNAQVTGLRGWLRGMFTRQQRQIVARLRELFADKAGEIRRDGTLVRIVFDIAAANKELKVRATAAMEAAADLGTRQEVGSAGMAAEAAEAAIDQANASPALRELIRREAWRQTTLVNGRTRELLTESLGDGLTAGENVNELADRVQSVFEVNRKRARLIAQQTTGQVYSQARAAGRAAAGFTHKGWIHSRTTADHRPTHIAAEARYLANPIPVGELFEVGEARLKHPRDAAAGVPGETINCQCLSVGRFAGQSPRAAVLAATKAAVAIAAGQKEKS